MAIVHGARGWKTARQGLRRLPLKLVVTGATGFLGQRLVVHLQAGGHSIVAPSRSRVPFADLSRPESYRSHFEGADAVIHLAAENPRAWSWRAWRKSVMEEVNVAASARLAEIAADCGVRHFVFASSARVYGIGSSPYSETSPLLGGDAYGSSKISAESAILQAAFGTQLQVMILRMPVMREKSGGIISLANRLAQWGMPLPDRLANARKSVLTTSRFNLAIDAVLADHEGAPHIYNVCDSAVTSIGQLCANDNGARVRQVAFPDWLYSLMFALPVVGFAVRHACSDCVLDCSAFAAQFTLTTKSAP